MIQTNPITLPTPSQPNLALKILRSPALSIVLLGVIFVFMIGLNSDILGTYANDASRAIQHCLAIAIAGLTIYYCYGHFLQQRPVTEMALTNLGRELGLGLLIGTGLYTICILILMVLGIYRIEGFNSWTFLLPAVAMALSSGVFEELLFRGVLFLGVEHYFGTWVGLVVSSLVFGLTHLINPAGTLEGALFIAVEAGILLAGAVMLTRRLWLGMGFHFSWNYTQSGIFSGIVSGNVDAAGFIKPTIKGPDLLTGGNFGVESSILALIVCTITGITLVVMAVRRGHIVPPLWKRSS